jgi:hypothetical protein
MDNALATLTKTDPSATIDRPGWIPSDLAQEWDPDPYAYQTEEELMPAGGLHGHMRNDEGVKRLKSGWTWRVWRVKRLKAGLMKLKPV